MSVILSTFVVFLTRVDKYGVKTVKHIKRGLNLISVHQLQFNNPHASEEAKIGLIVAVVALTCLDTCANFKKPLWLVDLLHP
ncbi:Sulfate transporter 2.1 [Camellia lanceoleosa]|uniref:Sulfate transporter 2.1 n=1 Tax=Camellia lanceoleosa TaxID=1840588 RepID=A0ACC0HKA7_9ERIC|nr:Sulfate transporter 2.1 [Camellia lanceoleosa]